MKKICALVLSLFLIFQMGSGVVLADESGTPKHIPRVVSIVFDDSGSMYRGTDRWAYTSYAMQAFSAMMSEEDVLYVTYLNAPAGTVKIDLSKANKQKTIDGFASTVFGGGTPNKLQQGANCLTKEYAIHGANARYYLVAMADGELDLGQGDFATDLPHVASQTKAKITGADFETIYFSMKDAQAPAMEGVTSYAATTGDAIVSKLRDISAEIMGRTDITKDCSISNGKISFTLPYPALNITLFAQKENQTFSNVKIPVTKDGKAASYAINTYYVKCPTEIIKNTQTTQYTEVKPANPPAGFVSLIGNGNDSLPKGTYTIDLSAYGFNKEDLVVLVEPAVRIGCEYSLGDSEEKMTFDELKANLREDESFNVYYGLYEMNADGSLGDAIPNDVLSPEYKFYIGDSPAGEKLPNKENAYRITATKEIAEKELKVEAVLEGYQPFVVREQFGQLKIKPVIDPDPNEFVSEITLTKDLWTDWLDGTKTVSFPLTLADASLLADLEIRSSFDGMATGNCAELKDCVKIDGNNIVYSPKLLKDTAYGTLPEQFTISLYDTFSNSALADIKVTVIQPAYKFEMENELEGVAFNLELLKNNTKSVKFTLMADYSGNGAYLPVSESNCESEIKLSVDSGILSGQTAEGAGMIAFTPQYDAAVHTDIAPSDILGKDHSVSAAATVDGVVVQSEKVSFSVKSGDYQIVVENSISQAFTLDTIKQNTQKVVFSILADYEGDGTFGALAEWDTSVYDKLSINAGDLPGKFETEYDAAGAIVGKSFTPLYDENNNNGIVFTKVAGKVHTIEASVEQYGISNKTEVEVLPPQYDIVVRKDGIRLVDVALRDNEQGVEFAVSRDGRVLTKEELEALAPYQLSFNKEQKWMSLESQIMTAEDGTAYLFCKPTYNGWTWISSGLWNWLCIFNVSKGDMEIKLTVGADMAAAQLHIGTSTITWIIFAVIVAAIAVILWITFCYLTRIRFSRGTFYRISFTNSAGGMLTVNGRIPYNANRRNLMRFFLSGQFFLPFREQTMTINATGHSAKFKAQKTPYDRFRVSSLPYGVTANGQYFTKGNLSTISISNILMEAQYQLDAMAITGHAYGANDIKMDPGCFLHTNGRNEIIFFLSKKEEKKLRDRYRQRHGMGQRRAGQNNGAGQKKKTTLRSKNKLK